MGFFAKLLHKKQPAVDLPSNLPPLGDTTGPWEKPTLPTADQQLSPRQQEMNNYSIPPSTQQTGPVSGERYQSQGQISPKDVELILSKLDLVNSRLDTLNQRLDSLEIGRKPATMW